MAIEIEMIRELAMALTLMATAACSGTDRTVATGEPDRKTESREAGAAAPARPIAIELFTSQGCSSCPPADELIAEYADDPDLVILSRPVTYWDRLGWRDTLGREENTDLQRAYASRLRDGGGRVYTPQAVVDGRFGLVGSRRQALNEAIAQASDEQADIDMVVAPNEAGDARQVVISGNVEMPATLYLVALDERETVAIGRGENSGRTLTYINFVLREHVVGDVGARGAVIALSEMDLAADGADRHALILRRGAAGPIIAARYL